MDGRVSIVATAPLRVDLAGGFSDVPPFCEERGGFVVNVAIQQFAMARAAAGSRGMDIRLRRAPRDWIKKIYHKNEAVEPDDPLAPFVVCVRDAGLDNIKLTIRSGGPPSSGLGTSGAALVAAQAAVRTLAGLDARAVFLAKRAREIEVDELQHIGGGQDPIAAAHGGILAISFVKGGRAGRARKLFTSDEFIKSLERRMLLVDLDVPRASSARIARVAAKIVRRDNATILRLEEMAARARDAARSIRREWIDDTIESICKHAAILRDLDPCIYDGGVGAAIDAAVEAGARCGKPCGAGGGGCVAIFTEPDRRASVISAMRARGFRIIPVKIARDGVIIKHNN
ncbi:MAG: hypothetical protein ACKVS6_13170 [Planctomycetota bacterium]